MIIVIAAYVQNKSGDPLDLPLPLWIAALSPIVLSLITGGYFKNFKSPIISAELQGLPEATQSPAKDVVVPTPSNWTSDRVKEYARVDGYMLAHVYRPAEVRGQTYDIFIFLVRHRKDTVGQPKKNFDDIEKVEFFFGDSWSNQVFTIQNSGGVLGVRTHAWGTFLATCRVTFRQTQREPIVLHRYVDFHMLQDNPTHGEET